MDEDANKKKKLYRNPADDEDDNGTDDIQEDNEVESEEQEDSDSEVEDLVEKRVMFKNEINTLMSYLKFLNMSVLGKERRDVGLREESRERNRKKESLAW